VNALDAHVPPTISPTRTEEGSQKRKQGSGKRERGVKEDSSFHLNAHENAVKISAIPMLEHGTPTFSVEIEGVWRRLILDTGSNVSIQQPGVSKSDFRVTAMRPYGVTGEFLDIKGLQSVSFQWDSCEINHSFLVCSLPTGAAGLLGTDFMEKTGVIMKFVCSKVTLTSVNKAPRAYSVSLTWHLAFTVFSGKKDGRNPQVSQRESWRMDEQVSISPAHGRGLSQPPS